MGAHSAIEAGERALVPSDRAVILSALHQVMEAVPYVQKTGNNAHFKYKFASEADVLAALRPAMLEAGLMLVPSVESYAETGGKVFVEIHVTMSHKSGAVWPDRIVWRGCGQDSQDKALAKAITSAQKYGMLKLFQIETGDDPDTDGKPKEKAAARNPKPSDRTVSDPAARASGGNPQPVPPPPPKIPQETYSHPWFKGQESKVLAACQYGKDALEEWWGTNKATLKKEAPNATLYNAVMLYVADKAEELKEKEH
jgi:hypothetical protein